MTQDGYKKLEDITAGDIKEAALAYAKQFNVEAGPESCVVTPVSRKLTIQEIGALAPLTELPISKWNVVITPSATSTIQQRVKVIVEYLTGSVCAMQLLPSR